MSANIMLPGQPITSEVGFLRGHGTYQAETAEGFMLTSSLAGEMERMNRLISVKSFHSRYVGETGDLVVGRITAVDSKRWKVELGAVREAVLNLSAITLPGAEQRLRTYEDQLGMRRLYQEKDLICCEVSGINIDGTLQLHTRNLRYGKLENGLFLSVPPQLMKRLPSHYLTLPSSIGFDLIFGKNGGIWIVRTIPAIWKEQTNAQLSANQAAEENGMTPLSEQLIALRLLHRQTAYTREQRMIASRLKNAVRILTKRQAYITPENVLQVYGESVERKMEVKDMLCSSIEQQEEGEGEEGQEDKRMEEE